MKFTLSWLKDHLDTTASLDDIVEMLTKIGLEVEHVDDPAKKLSDFIVAYVIEAKPHPNADRLRVCMVDTGADAPVQVVCGAPNARTGMKSAFSPPGTYIPGKDMTLGKGVIRGVDSNGMLCSSAELQLSGDHDGILDLPEDAPVGMGYADYAQLSDPLIDINLTPNRPDATGVYGIARDLAAAGLGILKEHAIKPALGSFACPASVTLNLTAEDKHLAPAFALRSVRGVKNGPSPEWMQKRLKAIGLRPINALVDITNYITFDHGRPLHVFDADKVKGNLVVRRAKDGEQVIALDGKTYLLAQDNVVICDDNGIESIAGIMGGEHSGCDGNTTEVLIESALWNPMNIARSGRTLGIVTDARYRFERGVDPAFCIPGAELATQLVMQLCGGEASELIIAGAAPDGNRSISFPLAEVERLTGLSIPRADKIAILQKLGFAIEGAGDVVNAAIPSWRPDIEGKADLVEEIMRITGVDNVASAPLPRATHEVPKAILTLLQKRTRLARRTLASQGLLEAVTWSFISQDRAHMFGGGKPELALANPIAADLSDMRPSLLPGLIAAAQRNADRGFGDVALFEAGQIFLGAGETDQRMAVSAIRRGTAKPAGSGRHWSQKSGAVDVFDAKADAMALLGALGIATGSLNVSAGAPSYFHPGRSGVMQFGPKNIIGYFGELHPRVLDAMGASGPLCGFEIILEALPAPKSRPTKIKPKLELSEFMPLERDFAFVVDNDVKAADILRAAQAGDKTLVTGVSLFDVYAGLGIPEGKKSVAIAVTLQPRDRTLTDAEIENAATRIIAEVTKKTGAVLRG